MKITITYVLTPDSRDLTVEHIFNTKASKEEIDIAVSTVKNTAAYKSIGVSMFNIMEQGHLRTNRVSMIVEDSE